MGIDGLILLDNSGRPIIQSGFRASFPAYPLLHVDAVNDALSQEHRPGNLDPVIHVPAVNIGDPPSVCCHVKCADMRFLCPISGTVDPLLGFAFLQALIDILQEYFGTVSAAILRENFDVVYQLLEEILDSGGHPLTTSPNALRDIVLPPSLLNKLLSVAGANFNSAINSGSGLGGAGGAFSSPIPWRKAGLRYTSNEMYLDIVEDLQAIVNKTGVTLSSTVVGKIEMNVKLSGTPDCLLNFTNAHVLADSALHPCVRLQRWTKDKTCSFVPPDGKFVLLDYRYAPTAATASSVAQSQTPISALGRDQLSIPFIIKSNVELEGNSASFHVMLTSRLPNKSLENLVVHLNLGDGASGIQCVAGHGTGGRGAGMGMDLNAGGNGGASWAFDSKLKVLKWEIGNVPPSSSWNLKGSFVTVNNAPRPSHAIQVRFEIQSHTFSSLKVEQLKVTGETYKLYKGVRGRAVGNVEWRW